VYGFILLKVTLVIERRSGKIMIAGRFRNRGARVWRCLPAIIHIKSLNHSRLNSSPRSLASLSSAVLRARVCSTSRVVVVSPQSKSRDAPGGDFPMAEAKAYSISQARLSTRLRRSKQRKQTTMTDCKRAPFFDHPLVA